MSELLWKIAEDDRLRAHIIEQDLKFQSVMRAYLGWPNPDDKPPPRVLPAPQPKPEETSRDVLDLATIAPLLRQPMHWKVIVEQVCIAHQVTRSELLGAQRSKKITAARHEAMYRMKTETTLSLPQIGQRLGGKDHTTVLHGVRRHEARMRGEVYRQPTYGKAREAAGA